MKTTKKLIVSVFTLFISLTIQAQTPYNPPLDGGTRDVLRLLDDSQKITLSQPEVPNACYEWSGPRIQTDPSEASITVNPTDPVSVYRVRRISHCGVDESEITVRLVDTISIVNIIPKSCFNAGDSMRDEDFEVITNPRGYGHLAKHTPTVALNSAGSVVDETVVTFRLIYGAHESVKTVTVSVINDNLTNAGVLNLPLKDFMQKLNDAKEMLKKARTCTGFLDKVSGGFACAPNSPDVSLDINMPQSTCYCCNGNVVDAFTLIWPTISGSISGDCTIPLPGVSIPFVGGLSAVITLTGSIALGPFNLRIRGACTQGDVPVEFAVDLYGGVQVAFISKNVLSASLKIGGGGKTGWVWTILKKTEWEGLEFTAAITGEIKTLGFLSSKVNVTLGKATLFK